MSSKRRRPSRATANDRAYCPFTLRTDASPVAPGETGETSQPCHNVHQPVEKKRSAISKLPIQVSPFEPVGKFRTHPTMDVHYDITPREKWTDMKRHEGCFWMDKTYLNDDFVFVANDRSTAHGRLGKDRIALVESGRLWVARILEIRAADECSVYARVCWMYSPNELPTGRQPYHGKTELIASNHQDVIGVFSIIGHAQVSHWVEADGRERFEGLYWRQAFDCRSEELSAVDLVCRCRAPDNPEKTLVGCTNSDCGNWMHFDCLHEDVMKRVYDRVGTDSPHIPAATEADVEPCAAQVLAHTCTKGKEGVFPMSSAHFDTESNSLPQYVEDSNLHMVELASPRMPKRTRPTTRMSGKTKASRQKADPKLYRQRFRATLRMDRGPMAWVVKDVRPRLAGSVQTWREPVLCLLCGAKIK